MVDSYRKITRISVNICPAIVSVEEKTTTNLVEKRKQKSFNFSSLLFYREEKLTHFVESSDNYIKKLATNPVPENTKQDVLSRKL